MKFKDKADEAFESNVGRIVAFVLAPILLPVAATFAAWAQNAVGVDLHPDAVVALVVSTVVGLAAVVYKWISNRGQYERLLAEWQNLHDTGAALEDPTPVVPPGLQP